MKYSDLPLLVCNVTKMRVLATHVIPSVYWWCCDVFGEYSVVIHPLTPDTCGT